MMPSSVPESVSVTRRGLYPPQMQRPVYEPGAQGPTVLGSGSTDLKRPREETAVQRTRAGVAVRVGVHGHNAAVQGGNGGVNMRLADHTLSRGSQHLVSTPPTAHSITSMPRWPPVAPLQVPSNYTKQIEYVPFGWIRDIYPLVGNNEGAQGFDLFNSERDPKRAACESAALAGQGNVVPSVVVLLARRTC